MSAIKSGSTLRTLVLTPERIPDFLIPSRSPLRSLSPRIHRSSPDRTRLLSDDDSPGPSPPGTPPGTPPAPTASRRFQLRLPPRIRRPRHVAAASEDADADVTTRAAMSLPHVGKVTTCYGFRAVLAASPCTRRRESLFHKPVTVTDSDTDLQDPADPPPPAPGPSPGSGSRGSWVCLRPVRALGLQVLKDLKRPAAALKARSPAARRTRPR